MKNLGFRGFFALCIATLGLCATAQAQCCAGGSGSPIAGGASQGVLLDKQFEISASTMLVNTSKFFKQDVPVPDSLATFSSFNDAYEYFRVAYGVTKDFTMSVEAGYYFNKTEVGLNNNPSTTYTSRGISDIILFPRYDIINWTEEKHRTEVTLGLGFKIPVGGYNDSVGNVEPFSGNTYYVTKPTAVQLSSGAQDFIFYTFLSRSYTETKFRIFANAFYIKKGYNPNGEKLGDFGSVSLFAGKTVLKNMGLTLQARYEWNGVMTINESILLYGKPSNYFPEATGYKKVFVSPQISYTMGKFTVFAMADIPVYQYLNTSDFYTQVGTQLQGVVGVSFRFFTAKQLDVPTSVSGSYYCPMHPEVTSSGPSTCPTCGMDLIKKKK
jgi:hypothetical protein